MVVSGVAVSLLRVVVRSRKDASAVEAALEKLYPGWSVDVETLHGARSLDKALDEIKALNPNVFTIILLGREDEKLARELAPLLPHTFTVHIVPRARVRNARIEMIAQELARARTRFRLSTWWNQSQKTYVFTPKPSGQVLDGIKFEPSYDVFLGLGKGFTKSLSRLLGIDVPETPLLVRTQGNLHLVYSGIARIAEIEFRDWGMKPIVSNVDGAETVSVPLPRIMEANSDVLRAYEQASISFLKSVGEEFDTIIVPWSGGKDSTATLLLALKAFGSTRVKVVFTDTGTEFPYTVEYVDYLAKKLGVDVYKAYAGVDKALRWGAPMPDHDNRWCTGMKIMATESMIKKLAEGRTLIVIGDRESESARRARRPPLRVDERGYTVVTPIRFWGTPHVQLYLQYVGVEVNPLYEKGFYRVGCYMCPALRSWELHVIASHMPLYISLLKSKYFRRFVWTRVFRKTKPKETKAASFCTFECLGFHG